MQKGSGSGFPIGAREEWPPSRPAGPPKSKKIPSEGTPSGKRWYTCGHREVKTETSDKTVEEAGHVEEQTAPL